MLLAEKKIGHLLVVKIMSSNLDDNMDRTEVMKETQKKRHCYGSKSGKRMGQERSK